ncbi:MAG: hypothetical protein ACT4QG_21225, partial [Sporichthyaceae bacterium]
RTPSRPSGLVAWSLPILEGLVPFPAQAALLGESRPHLSSEEPAKAAQADLKAAKAAAAPDCFAGPVMARFGGDGTRTTSVNSTVPVTVKGATDAVAFKMTLRVDGTQDPKKIVVYVVQAVVDRVRVSILLARTNGTQPALAFATRLAGVAVAKVLAKAKE